MITLIICYAERLHICIVELLQRLVAGLDRFRVGRSIPQNRITWCEERRLETKVSVSEELNLTYQSTSSCEAP